jgi:hypothetical protein
MTQPIQVDILPEREQYSGQMSTQQKARRPELRQGRCMRIAASERFES